MKVVFEKFCIIIWIHLNKNGRRKEIRKKIWSLYKLTATFSKKVVTGNEILIYNCHLPTKEFKQSVHKVTPLSKKTGKTIFREKGDGNSKFAWIIKYYSTWVCLLSLMVRFLSKLPTHILNILVNFVGRLLGMFSGRILHEEELNLCTICRQFYGPQRHHLQCNVYVLSPIEQ